MENTSSSNQRLRKMGGGVAMGNTLPKPETWKRGGRGVNKKHPLPLIRKKTALTSVHFWCFGGYIQPSLQEITWSQARLTFGNTMFFSVVGIIRTTDLLSWVKEDFPSNTIFFLLTAICIKRWVAKYLSKYLVVMQESVSSPELNTRIILPWDRTWSNYVPCIENWYLYIYAVKENKYLNV